MHVLFVHQNFPAQFGHIAARLVGQYGFRCTFATARRGGVVDGVECLRYSRRGGATERTHRLSRSFENFTWQSHAVYEALRARPEVRPDVIVGHSGFGSTLFLADLFDRPIVNHCEWYYQPDDSDGEFLDHADGEYRIRSRARNAMLLADLQACGAGYSPTWWQRSRFPREYQRKLATIFDGIDTSLWRPRPVEHTFDRRVGRCTVPEGVRVVTYVARGFESMRGFDVFMEIARRICERRSDVVFLCVGTDQVYYGSDMSRIREKSFREHVLQRHRLPEGRLLFAGEVPRDTLARAFWLSDLHVYLTAPFVLSWSLMNALSCGCPVLASDTPPLREVLEHGRNGLMSAYFDVDHFVELALQVLDDPAEHRRTLGEAGRKMIEEQYSLDVVLPRMLDLYERAIAGRLPDAPSVAERTERLPASNGDGLGLPRLRHESHLRPTEGAAGEPNDGDGWISTADRVALADAMPDDARLIVELGAWEGHRTRLLAEMRPAATIVAIDRWPGCPEPAGHPDWKPRLPQVWERFARNCRAAGDHILPLASPLADGLQQVADAGLEPDAIVIDCDYDAREVRDVIAEARRLFPKAVLIGDDWRWWAMREAVRDLAATPALDISTSGNTWVARTASAGRTNRALSLWSPSQPQAVRGVPTSASSDGGRVFQVGRLRAVPLPLPLSPQHARELGAFGLQCGCGGTLQPGCLNTDSASLVDSSGLRTQRGRLYLCDDATLYLEHDATQPFPIEGDVFDWVYSEHFIEHLPPEAAAAWLRETQRMLKPGGLLRISTPDLAKYASGYTDPQGKFYQVHQQRLRAMGVRETSQRKAWMLNQIFRLWQHQWIYDFAELEQAVVAAGFPKDAVRQCGFQQGRFEHVARLDQPIRNDESVYLEAEKPELVVRPLGRARTNKASGGPRVLIAIPHYHAQTKSRLFGSLKESRQARGRALGKCLASLHASFGGQQWMSCLAKPERFVANEATGSQLTVLVCTTGGQHALADCRVPAGAFRHVEVDVPGPFLGYACHAKLRKGLGHYDYYCYLEDDLLIRDPWWFQKLAWFASQMGEECLLQPNRYELSRDGSGVKVYIDGDLPPVATARYQDVTVERQRIANYLGADLVFRRTLNPHAGCFFLTASQMQEWSQRPYFLDRDRTFYSPLESAASAGIMRTFRVYKPVREAANFFEVQHSGDAWLRKIARRDQAARSGRRPVRGFQRSFDEEAPKRRPPPQNGEPQPENVLIPSGVEIVLHDPGVSGETSGEPEPLRFKAEGPPPVQLREPAPNS